MLLLGDVTGALSQCRSESTWGRKKGKKEGKRGVQGLDYGFWLGFKKIKRGLCKYMYTYICNKKRPLDGVCGFQSLPMYVHVWGGGVDKNKTKNMWMDV